MLKNSGREGAQMDILNDPQMDRKPWKRQERICEKVRLITEIQIAEKQEKVLVGFAKRKKKAMEEAGKVRVLY